MNAQPNASSESWTSRLKICAITTKWRRFSESVKRRYSFTTSICLSITCPVNRSIATCTQ